VVLKNISAGPEEGRLFIARLSDPVAAALLRPDSSDGCFSGIFRADFGKMPIVLIVIFHEIDGASHLHSSAGNITSPS